MAKKLQTACNIVLLQEMTGSEPFTRGTDFTVITKQHGWDWNGLGICVQPEFSIDSKSTEFIRFAAQNEWQHVRGKLGGFLLSLFSTSEFTEKQKAFCAFICAFSGPLRQDGLLIAHLHHKMPNHPFGHVIVCNTHLESFDPVTREKQIAELIDQIKILRKAHPNATIIFGGDLNQSQLDPIFYQDKEYDSLIKLFEKELGAKTMPESEMKPTFTHPNKQGETIDAVYCISPIGDEVIVDGKILVAKSDSGERLSDHDAPVYECRIKQSC
jgi:hypothetical protein